MTLSQILKFFCSEYPLSLSQATYTNYQLKPVFRYQKHVLPRDRIHSKSTREGDAGKKVREREKERKKKIKKDEHLTLHKIMPKPIYVYLKQNQFYFTFKSF